MTPSLDNFNTFFAALTCALDTRTLIKLILSKPRDDLRWRRIIVAPFTDARGTMQIAVEYFDKTQTVRKNIPIERALEEVHELLPTQMAVGHLKVPGEELVLEKTARDSFRLKRIPLTTLAPKVPTHNRAKKYLLSDDCPFLVELGIATRPGEIRRDKHDKFRQIQKFLEIIATLLPQSSDHDSTISSVVDFGSGKHYLTFALHHFLSSRSADVVVRGIEQRADLVTTGQRVASAMLISNLEFIQSTIAEAPVNAVDLVVALHACDTATDDALAKAIRARARYICVAPCCHSYVRNRFTPSEDLIPLLRHGILADRFADSLTDSLRVLTLEALGYQTKLFEFISPEHTAKNTMIVAHLAGQPKAAGLSSIQALKLKFGLTDYYLDLLLKDRLQAIS